MLNDKDEIRDDLLTAERKKSIRNFLIIRDYGLFLIILCVTRYHTIVASKKTRRARSSWQIDAFSSWENVCNDTFVYLLAQFASTALFAAGAQKNKYVIPKDV